MTLTQTISNLITSHQISVDDQSVIMVDWSGLKMVRLRKSVSNAHLEEDAGKTLTVQITLMLDSNAKGALIRDLNLKLIIRRSLCLPNRLKEYPYRWHLMLRWKNMRVDANISFALMVKRTVPRLRVENSISQPPAKVLNEVQRQLKLTLRWSSTRNTPWWS